MDERVRVTGLKELARELKTIDRSWGKELAKAAKEAAKIIATDAKRRGVSAGSTLAKAAESFKPGGTQRGGYVKIGGSDYPYALGAEFGSDRYPQFQPWRGAGQNAGYALYPAIRGKREEVVEQYGHAIDELTRRAFPD